PRHLPTLHNRAVALAELNSLDEALAACDQVLGLDSRHVDALNIRGIVLLKLKRYADALASYDAALSTAPGRTDIETNRGKALLELDRFDEALAGFERALAGDANDIVALIHRGNALIKLKRPAEALASYDRALAIDPDHAIALTDRGVALTLLDRFEEALALHERALRVDPDLVGAHINRGNTLVGLTRMKEALDSYAEAIAREPGNVEANFNAAITRLCSGDFEEGWKQYEYRWKKKDVIWRPSEYAQPVWRGERDLRGKTVCLLAEQGLGDTIQFMRYAPMVADLGARVILGVQRPLTALAATVPGISVVYSDGDALPDFDLHCALLSLPLAFATELATIPANIPYVRPYQERIAVWRPRFPDNGRLRIGLCWAGNPDHLNDRNRSMPLERLIKMLSMPGLDLVSVQKVVSEADAAILRDYGVVQLGQQFADFSDTAAVVAMLDLLITVDTSVAHLAGAMGKAVALLLPLSPDWRWLLGRTDSPWYPTMRLFRQTAIGDWEDPLERLRCELEEVARRPRHSAAPDAAPAL
ncbi:MAG TPA: tetratricopeptide repeat-containing glycosyltransferase family protein, partial [Xanthobacteraceae bacterium]|nr:tetratricopeptide repeat-containing glycosyltransferase family protein [Xanthobacteraceae bacterium]